LALVAIAEALVARAATLGKRGRTLSSDERNRLTAALPAYPSWLLDLLTTVPLCGLELGWQADDAEPDDDGLGWVRVSDADGILFESLEAYPGLGILPAGYLNFGKDAIGGGDPYFLPIHEGEDPPLYQVYHDVGQDAATILADGRLLVAARLSDFFRSAVLDGE
jgi:hypothetical protein